MRSLKINDPSKLWFTSDLHFGHKNIITFCDRPFKGVDRMNEAMIDNWNNLVQVDDTVIVTGDFCFSEKSRWVKLLNILKGNIILVRGNHDRHKQIPSSYFEYGVNLFELLDIKVKDEEIPNDQHIVACHYPMKAWNGSHRGSWQVFGHIHSTKKGDWYNNQYDVGVDLNNFTPVSYLNLKAIITKQYLK